MRLLSICLLLLLITKFSFAQEIEHPHDIRYSFLENKGQWHSDILFQSKFNGGNLWIQQQRFLFHFQDLSSIHHAHEGKNESKEINIKQSFVFLEFPGSNKVSNFEKLNPTKSYYNYFIGNTPSKWAANVHGYSEAFLNNFYDKIDLKLIENKKELKYEFHIHPGASPKDIQLDYNGQTTIKKDKNGNLIIESPQGRIIEKKPYSYQIINGKIIEIANDFILTGSRVTFNIGKYNPDYTLIIDPTLIFATYSGSPSDNFGMTATYGYDGTAYSAGTVFGNQYPAPDPMAWNPSSNITIPDVSVATTDVFVSKYSADGTTMLWTNFVGGGNNTIGTETVHSLICDANNNVYIYGATSSTDFPVSGGYQTTHGGGSLMHVDFNGARFDNAGVDIFVAKISSNGQNLMGSTYMGGSGNDGINYKVSSGTYNSVAAYDSLTTNYGDQFRGEIMLDENGNCLVASCTRSTNFPVLNAFQSNNAGQQDGVIFKLSANLSTLMWSSYFGGANNDACYSVKVDSSFNIVFAGGTSSNNLPLTAGAWQSSYNGGKTDGFVAKLTPAGTVLTKVSYIGTNNYDQVFFVEIDRNDNIFLLGQSAGGNFQVVNATYSNPNSSQFICKLNPSLTSVLNSTVFGAGTPTTNISPSAFLVDICGNLYVSGWGSSVLGNQSPLAGMPVTPNAFQATPPNGFDFYLMVLDRTFDNLIYATYVGGAFASEHVDGGTSRFDKNGIVYQSVCGGCGGNSDFPTSANAWSSDNLSTNCNNIIFKFDFGIIPRAEFSADNTLGCTDFVVTLNNTSSASDSYIWDFGNGDTTSVIYEPVITYDTEGTYDIYLYVTDSICLLTDTAHIVISVYDSTQLSINQDTTICLPAILTFTANSFGTADYFIWSSDLTFSDTLNTTVNDSTLTLEVDSPSTFYIKVGNPGCYQIDSVSVIVKSAYLSLNGNDSICAGDTITVNALNSDPDISYSYLWQPDSIILGANNLAQVEINPNISQYIYIDVSYLNGCSYTDSMWIAVSQVPITGIIGTANDYYIPEGSTVTLSAYPTGLVYEWLPEDIVTATTTQTTQATISETTLFTVFAGDGICMRSDTVLVSVYSFVCDDPFVFVPSAFSPNADNENDILYVRGEMIYEMTFRIFDRWGELVFESHDTHHGWDGTFKGKNLDPDVYDYYLEVTCVDQKTTIKKGNITLLK